VVLDGDLQPRVLHLASDLAQEAHDGLDVRLDRPGRHRVPVARQERADDGRAHRGGALDVPAERRHDLRVGFGGPGQDGAAAGLEVQAQVARPRADLGPVPRVHHGRVRRVLQEHRVEPLAGAVVEHLAVGPALEPEAVGVEPERPPTTQGKPDGCECGHGADEIAAFHAPIMGPAAERSSLHVRPALIDEVLSTLRVLSPR